MAGERGFTLIEILIAMALVSIGVAATISVFGSSSRATVRAQRGEVGVQQAQAEIDRLSTLEYGETALTSRPPPPPTPTTRATASRPATASWSDRPCRETWS